MPQIENSSASHLIKKIFYIFLAAPEPSQSGLWRSPFRQWRLILSRHSAAQIQKRAGEALQSEPMQMSKNRFDRSNS
jgi:hypothetical protein